MCGISGVASKRLDRSTLEPVIDRMARTLRHRGPDGTYVECFGPPAVSEHVALAHNRLAIIDVSDRGREPMSNEDGTVWLVFNGEIYNFKELRGRLEASGHRFGSHTDAEVIIHLYEEIGRACVNDLEGIFAFAILDLKRDLLFLARDPLGVKPLFYAATKDSFLFGSEIKAILASSLVDRVPNRQAISDFFTFLYVPCPETAFEGILQLPAAHCLAVELKDLTVSARPYWRPHERSEWTRASYEELKSAIRETLAASVRRQLVSDVPLGVFLSGGVDSTIVTGLAKNEKSDVQTYTLTVPGEEYKFYDESEKGRAVSRHLKTEHFELPMERPDFLELVNLMEFSDQPFANPTNYLMWQLSQKARTKITVALCGAGGDELFAGYPRTSAVRLARKLGWVPKPLLRFGTHFLEPLRDSQRNPRLRRARKFLGGLDSDFLTQYANWTYFLNERDKHELFCEWRNQEHQNSWRPSVEILRTAYNDCSAPGPDNRLLELDVRTFLADNILEYTDRMSMATGLEVRVPLLDRSFVELSLNTPFSYKIQEGRTKAILVDAFSDFFPPEVREAPKRGFNAPLGQWIGRFFDDYFDESSAQRGGRFGQDVGAAWREGVLDLSFIKRMRAEHREGKADRSHELFACVIFDAWWRKYIRKTELFAHW